MIILSFLSSALLVFFTYTSVDAFQAKVLPSEINPGDAFIIKVTGNPYRTETTTSYLPTAVLNNKSFNFSSCGERCFIAIGAIEIETKPGVYPIHLSVGEKRIDLNLLVKHTTFPTLSLTLPEDKVFLSPINQRRVEREDERLKSIFQTVTDRLWEGSFKLPLENDFLTPFGTKRIINKKRISVHRGLDIKGKEGEEVKASNKGRVVLAEELFFGGNTVILDHGQGIFTIYMHLSKFNVNPENIVSKDHIIGFVGSSGRSSDHHLHFGVKVLNINTNPVSFLKLNL